MSFGITRTSDEHPNVRQSFEEGNPLTLSSSGGPQSSSSSSSSIRSPPTSYRNNERKNSSSILDVVKNNKINQKNDDNTNNNFNDNVPYSSHTTNDRNTIVLNTLLHYKKPDIGGATGPQRVKKRNVTPLQIARPNGSYDIGVPIEKIEEVAPEQRGAVVLISSNGKSCNQMYLI